MYCKIFSVKFSVGKIGLFLGIASAINLHVLNCDCSIKHAQHGGRGSGSGGGFCLGGMELHMEEIVSDSSKNINY